MNFYLSTRYELTGKIDRNSRSTWKSRTEALGSTPANFKSSQMWGRSHSSQSGAYSSFSCGRLGAPPWPWTPLGARAPSISSARCVSSPLQSRRTWPGRRQSRASTARTLCRAARAGGTKSRALQLPPRIADATWSSGAIGPSHTIWRSDLTRAKSVHNIQMGGMGNTGMWIREYFTQCMIIFDKIW